MQIRHKLRLATTIGLAAGALTLGLVAPSVSGAATPSGTLTYAEPANTIPSYIFPYMSCSYFSVANISGFDYLMYRPLYWFGLGAGATYTPSLSLANSPTYNSTRTTVTMTTKGWKFADGQTINAQSVMFFLNMYKALPTDYCGYNAGYGIPDQVASAHGSGNTVVINFKSSVNTNWLLYNYLSEITPMADSWDVTAPGKTSTCATGVWGAKSTDAACTAVYNYLNGQSKIQTTGPDTMWQSGDSGPWTLTHFDSLGNATFVPNARYQGPQKAQVAKVVEIPYATAAAEETALRQGNLDLGYVDNTILTSNGTLSKPGANWSPIASKYNLEVGAPWSVDYAAYNFNPKYSGSKFLDQFYVRQALQDTDNQALIINKVFKGYGYVTNNPMPPAAPASLTGNASNKVRYPYSPTAALALLSRHGWTRVGGIQTCTRPGTAANDCGAGIAKGAPLTLSEEYVSGQPNIQIEVAAEVSEWKSIGINVTTTSAPFNLIVGNCVTKPSTWGICFWGAGWIYSPDYYPSGESLFVPGASFNIGLYSNQALTASVKQTTSGTASLAQFSNQAAFDLPVLYQANQTNSYSGGGIGEAIKSLKSTIGFTPNSLTNFMPEYYHF